jgi:excisionase family DNA binding protein
MGTGTRMGAQATANKLLLTTGEAAAMLSISRALLYRLIMHQRILSVKINGARRIPRQALVAYVDALCVWGSGPRGDEDSGDEDEDRDGG